MCPLKQTEILAIIGPTASGKTRRAVSIARLLKGEILSGDSRQVYRGMDIGTGKDLSEYAEIPYHLIDIRNAGDKYNLHDYINDFRVSFNDIKSRGFLPVLCGGSGLYVETALSGIELPDVPINNELREKLKGKSLDELAEILRNYKTLHNKTDIDTPKRAIRAIEIEEYYISNPSLAERSDRKKMNPLSSLIIGIDITREKRRKSISQRLEARLEEGMIEEVKKLLESGVSEENLIYYGLEYKFITLHVTGKISFEEMKSNLEIAIHQFAKRQMTWFRGMEKRGFNIRWLDHNLEDEEFNSKVMALLNNQP